MDEAIIAAIVGEVLKASITGYLVYAKQAGLTDDQIEAAFQDAKKRLAGMNPADLPKPPEA
jgi:hypothetical protein